MVRPVRPDCPALAQIFSTVREPLADGRLQWAVLGHRVGDGGNPALDIVGQVKALAGGMCKAGEPVRRVSAGDAITIRVDNKVEPALGVELLCDYTCVLGAAGAAGGEDLFLALGSAAWSDTAARVMSVAKARRSRGEDMGTAGMLSARR